MICLLIKDEAFVASLEQEMKNLGIKSIVGDPSDLNALKILYDPIVTAAVIENNFSEFPDQCWLDMISNLGRRIPIVIIGDDELPSNSDGRHIDTVTMLKKPTINEIISILDSCGVVGLNRKKVVRSEIPIYSPQTPLHMLQNHGSLSVLTINTSSFRNIALEYGTEVYYQVQNCFKQILYNLWGSPGCFRSADLLCRRSANSNTYFVFMEPSRTSGNIPAPGYLEKRADQLVVKLQNALWNELLMTKNQRIMPECITVLPEFSVGHATAIYNPCIDSLELLEQLLENSSEVARVQMKRMKDRQRELMQTLIQAKELLMPYYQGVFYLNRLTKDMIEHAASTNSIGPLKEVLYGFESLIRVRHDRVNETMKDDKLFYIDARYLMPNVLFALAGSAKVALELDQACLYQATKYSTKLPGVLLVNILPRNLYYIDRLKDSFLNRSDIIFEVSESEAINNFDLVIKVRSNLEKMNIGIATDDFGKGYAGVERLIKIKPDVVKLDRSLIENIHLDIPKQHFVKGLVQANKFSSTIVLAEGVERWEEAEVLKGMGIDLIQGYLAHRPQPVETILNQLSEEEKTLDAA